MKRIIFLLIIVTFSLFSLCNNKKALNASSDDVVKACLVANKLSYKKGDIVKLSFDLPQFSNLFSVNLQLIYDKNMLEVKSNNDQYFYLSNHSIFKKFLYNVKTETGKMNVGFLKEDDSVGFYSNYCNNLCNIDFVALKDIDNANEVFNSMVTFNFFDVNNTLIRYEFKVIEKINGEWLSNDNCIDVFSTIDVKKYFKVSNRLESEYLLFIDNDVDTSVIGQQIIQIGLFDLQSCNYQTFSRIMTIVDKSPPVIEGKAEFIINDYELDDFDFTKCIICTDNYDTDIKIDVEFYKDDKVITKQEAMIVLKTDLTIKCGYKATDKSLNQSETFFQIIKINDTIPPTIEGPSEIAINDYDLKDFKIEPLFCVSDNLLAEVKLIINYFNKEEKIIDWRELLTYQNDLYVEAWAVDKYGNSSVKKYAKIILVDTIPPEITGENILIINDTDLADIDFNRLIEYSDNCDQNPLCTQKYLIDNEEVGFLLFKELIIKGKKGKIIYTVSDKSNNSKQFDVEIIVNDTTKPTINVNNIKDGKTYKEVKKIDYSVIDNFDQEVSVTCLLNGEIYSGQALENGDYFLTITAIDKAGNTNVASYHFKVDNKNIFQNFFSGELKIPSLFFVIGIVVICGGVIIAKTLVFYRKR